MLLPLSSSFDAPPETTLAVEITEEFAFLVSESGETTALSLQNEEIEIPLSKGHETPVTTLATQTSETGTVICTASSDAIQFFNLAESIAAFEDGLLPCGALLRLKELPFPKSLEWDFSVDPLLATLSDPEFQWVAICFHCTVLVLNHKSGRIQGIFQGHNASISALAFLHEFLITTSEDGSFRVWHVRNRSLFYKSNLISASPLLCVSTSTFLNRFAIGAQDGALYIFTLNSETCRLLHKGFSSKLLVKAADGVGAGEAEEEVVMLVTDQPKWKQPRPQLEDDLESNEDDLPILSLKFDQNGDHLYIGIPDNIAVLNCTSYGVVSATLLSEDADELIGSRWFQFLYFQDEVCALLDCPDETFVIANCSECIAPEAGEGFSFTYTKALPPSSVLNNHLFSKSRTKPNGEKIVYRKIRSSGYTNEPRTRMFHPKINKKKKKRKRAKQQEDAPVTYYVDYDCINTLNKKLTYKSHNGPVYRCYFSSDGKHVLSCSSDGTACIRRVGMQSGLVFPGHKAAVRCCTWSLRDDFVLTGSDDCSAGFFIAGRTEPILLINSSSSLKRKPERIRSPITSVNFFHRDRFFLLSHGNFLSMYKFKVDRAGTTSDFQKMQCDRGRYHRTFHHDFDAKVETVACHNCKDSGIAVVSSAKRELIILDIGHGKEILTIPNPHNSKVVRSISLPKLEGVFATASTDSYVKLWDPRTARCVGCFSGHINRQQSIGVSQQSFFLAVGSENKLAYIYDIRRPGDTFLQRLQGHSDIVSHASFHPRKPYISTASFDGKIRFFHDPG